MTRLRYDLETQSRDVSAMLIILGLLLLAGMAGAAPKDQTPLPADFAKANQSALQEVAKNLHGVNSKLEVLLVLPAKHSTLDANLKALVQAFNRLTKKVEALEKLMEPLEPKGEHGTGPNPREAEAVSK